jgi:hypothetical protein
VPGLGEPRDGGDREVVRSCCFGEGRRADGDVGHGMMFECHSV